MTSEFRTNGKLMLIIRPSDEIERVILAAMAEAAEKGRTVTMARTAEEAGGLDAFQVSVER